MPSGVGENQAKRKLAAGELVLFMGGSTRCARQTSRWSLYPRRRPRRCEAAARGPAFLGP